MTFQKLSIRFRQNLMTISKLMQRKVLRVRKVIKVNLVYI